jgi:hypothetical protein
MQSACPTAQLVVHMPIEHTCPAAHAVPHAPQLARSVCVSRHEPIQLLWPAWHDGTHAPAAQVSPAAHAVPQAPQLRGSVCESTQRPLHSRWSAPHTPVSDTTSSAASIDTMSGDASPPTTGDEQPTPAMAAKPTIQGDNAFCL